MHQSARCIPLTGPEHCKLRRGGGSTRLLRALRGWGVGREHRAVGERRRPSDEGPRSSGRQSLEWSHSTPDPTQPNLRRRARPQRRHRRGRPRRDHRDRPCSTSLARHRGTANPSARVARPRAGLGPRPVHAPRPAAVRRLRPPDDDERVGEGDHRQRRRGPALLPLPWRRRATACTPPVQVSAQKVEAIVLAVLKKVDQYFISDAMLDHVACLSTFARPGTRGPAQSETGWCATSSGRSAGVPAVAWRASPSTPSPSTTSSSRAVSASRACLRVGRRRDTCSRVPPRPRCVSAGSPRPRQRRRVPAGDHAP